MRTLDKPTHDIASLAGNASNVIVDSDCQACMNESSSATPYHLLVSVDPVGILVLHAGNGAVTFMNPAAATCFDVDSAAIYHLTLTDFIADSVDREYFARNLISNGQLDKVDLLMKSQSGREFFGEISVRPLRYNNQSYVFLSVIDVSERKSLEAALRYQAETDELTGLWNRRKLMQELVCEGGRVDRYDRPCSMLSIDIDNFKEINDAHGHAVGDQVLIHISRKLSEELRPVDALGRMGGDEFAIIMPETEFVDALDAAERLRAAILDSPLKVDSHSALNSSISLGVCMLQPGDSPEHTLIVADEALYQAKAQGRNTVAA